MPTTPQCDVLLAEALAASPAHWPPDVAAHLAACPRCQREYAALHALDATIGRQMRARPVLGQPGVARTHRGGLPFSLRAAASGLLRVAALGVAVALAAALALLLLTTGGALQPKPDTAAATVVVTGQDRVWLVGVTPTASDDGTLHVSMDVGYRLASAPTGVLSLRLAGEGEGRYFCPPVEVTATARVATVECAVDVTWARTLLGEGPLRWEATLRAFNERGEAVLLREERFAQPVALPSND